MESFKSAINGAHLKRSYLRCFLWQQAFNISVHCKQRKGSRSVGERRHEWECWGTRRAKTRAFYCSLNWTCQSRLPLMLRHLDKLSLNYTYFAASLLFYKSTRTNTPLRLTIYFHLPSWKAKGVIPNRRLLHGHFSASQEK